MKKTLFACLGFTLFSALLAAIADQYGDFTYSSDGSVITIDVYTGMGGHVDIPETIEDLPVTSIGYSAFYQCTGLDSVTLPSNVVSIGDWAFGECTGLASVTILGRVVRFGDSAFSSCSALTSIMIPSSVTSIGSQAFYSCTNLMSITVADDNAAYSSTNGVLFDKGQTTLIQYPGGKVGDYTIPDSVAGIGDRAFSSCSGLTSVTIPGSVTSIGAQAFNPCGRLLSITVAYDNASYSSTNGVLFNKEQTSLLQCPGGKVGSYTIPGSVTSIGDFAFFSCFGLTGVIIPNTVISLGLFSFSSCSGLTSVTIPEGVDSLYDNAFYSCANLSSVFFKGIPPSYVGYDVFSSCSEYLTVYYLPGTSGWEETFPDLPVVLWNPMVEASSASFGVHNNQFGFNIIGTADIPVVVEARTNLTSGLWVPLQTGVLSGGSLYFSDPTWKNYSSRFYRIRSP